MSLLAMPPKIHNEGICEKHGMKLVVNHPHGGWHYTCLLCRIEALEEALAESRKPNP